MSQTKKRNIIIGALCTVLLLMVVGYAAFQSVLKINGTTNISSDWDVRITAIEKTASVGATDKEAPSYDNTKGLSATFNTNLTSPGDYATYKITITNSGSLDAVLKNITMPENTNNDIKFYLNKDQNNADITGALKENDTLTKSSESNNVGYVYVTVLYKDYANQQTAETKTASMTISFDFEQITGGLDNPIVPTEEVAYTFGGNVNIGDSISSTSSSEIPNTTFFFKHIIRNEKVERSELCFKKDEQIYCLKPNEYETSKNILLTAFNQDECTLDDNGIACQNSLFENSATVAGSVTVIMPNSGCSARGDIDSSGNALSSFIGPWC